MAALVHYFRLRRRFARPAGQAGAAASLGGLASGVFGIGCAACGTFVLGPVLAFFGAGGLIALMPLGGEEFGVLGVGMLGFSLVLTAKKIAEPIACPIGAPDDTGPRQPSGRPAGRSNPSASSLGRPGRLER